MRSEFKGPLKVNSWTIISEKTFVKRMDKSTFNHKGTGIPKKISSFWDIDDMVLSSKKKVKLYYENSIFEATIYNDSLNRKRLMWKTDLKEVIVHKYYELSQLYKEDNEVEQSPEMQFNKIDSCKYKLDFVDIVDNHGDSFVNDEMNTYGNLSEGNVVYSYSRRYERNPKIRNEAIKQHGLKCHVCGFVFEKKYGVLGKGYIEIHHNKPLYVNGHEVEVDIENDLTPVCSNCHRMIHRKRSTVYSVEYLRSCINRDSELVKCNI